MKRILICSAITALAMQFATAQQPDTWTLDRCISHALEQNINLKIQHNLEEKASNMLMQQKMYILPSINGYAQSQMSFRRGTNQNNDISSGTSLTTSYGISANLNLFSGFATLNSISAARFNELACEESTNLSENNLIITVTQLYSQALYQKKIVDVLREKLEISKNELERIKAKIEVGQLEQVAENEIKATVSNNLLELSRANNQYKLSLLKLSQTIEIPSSDDFTIDTMSFDQISVIENLHSTEDIYAAACASYPAILKKEYQLGYYKKMLRISQGGHSPSLSIEGGIGSSHYSTDTIKGTGGITPFDEQFDKYLSPGISATLSIPIFSNWSKTINVKQSKLDMENSMYELEDQKKLIKQEIESAVFESNALYFEYLSAVDNLSFVEKSFESYREKYRLGLMSTTDFISAQNQLASAKASVKSAQYSWIVKEKTIELYKGKSVASSK